MCNFVGIKYYNFIFHAPSRSLKGLRAQLMASLPISTFFGILALLDSAFPFLEIVETD